MTGTKVALFMGVGFGAWLVGMHQLFYYNTVQSGEGVGNEFIYIIAAVIGGCLLTGGYGSVFGASIGALIFGMTNLGIVYAGWDADWFKPSSAVMLIGAVLVNHVVKRKAEWSMTSCSDSTEVARRTRPCRSSSWTTSASATATSARCAGSTSPSARARSPVSSATTAPASRP